MVTIDDETTRWAIEAARAADDKQGGDTVVLTVGEVLAITEHFVITHGNNARQVRTIAEEVERRISDAGGPKPLRIEGLDDVTWVLLDYGDFVVHVFHEEARRFYELERLWADVPKVAWEPEGASVPLQPPPLESGALGSDVGGGR